MKHKTSELTGALLDASVALADGVAVFTQLGSVWRALVPGLAREMFDPHRNWTIGGPIIDRERIAVYFERSGYPAPGWVAGFELGIDRGFRGSETTGADEPTLQLSFSAVGPTPLIAAMRAFVASIFGDEVELP